MFRNAIFLGAVFGGLAVALGAFGAHWLEGAVRGWGLEAADQSRRLTTWEVAVRYQMFHALALLVVGMRETQTGRRKGLCATTNLFVIGVTIFSGCLYALVLTGIKMLGEIVPIGGACLVAGWLTLACSELSQERNS